LNRQERQERQAIGETKRLNRKSACHSIRQIRNPIKNFVPFRVVRC
jgi:hypothetical protein